ncbi:14714_t:CDS:2 [Entrophospora sp. SA101]|nr:14714_t:CDS:2 [Entrophospora sp. SA101]CAJ0899853.1 14464_t:CDS:2 [Entrophospora sp. SA101]
MNSRVVIKRCLYNQKKFYSTNVINNEFFEKNFSIPNSIVKKSNKLVSRLGFGSYRINHKDEESHQALRLSINNGINVIDTSSNFENGESEQVIGKVLKELFSKGSVKPDDLVVISKAGYFQTLDTTTTASLDNSFVKINNQSFHSMSPKFLYEQLNDSLKRLQLDCLDIFMLNNPERMLQAKNKHYSINRLYDDILKAFDYLDTEVSKGRIKGYGICSNSMTKTSSIDHISLPRIYEKMSSINKKNFTAIQSNDIFVFTNRPLNAIAPDETIRILVNNKNSLSEREIVNNLETSFKNLNQLENDNIITTLSSEERLRLENWIIDYKKESQLLISSIINYSHLNLLQTNNELDSLLSIVSPSLNLESEEKEFHSPLSVKALRIYLANSNIGCVLVGMRKPIYVKDSINTLKLSDGDSMTMEALDEIYKVFLTSHI